MIRESVRISGLARFASGNFFFLVNSEKIPDELAAHLVYVNACLSLNLRKTFLLFAVERHRDNHCGVLQETLQPCHQGPETAFAHIKPQCPTKTCRNHRAHQTCPRTLPYDWIE